MFASINEIAVLVTAILAVAVEHVWYSPLLFGNAWRTSAGLAHVEDVQNVWHILRDSCLRIATFFIFYALSVSMVHHEDVSLVFSPLTYNLFFFAGILIMTLSLREQRSLTYLAIHVGYLALTIFGGIAIIVYWPW